MKKLIKHRLLSDLHLEFGDWDIPPHADDADTVLILAGDIHTRGRVVLPGCLDVTNKMQKVESYVERYAERFKAIIVILGNHDYWGGSLERIPQKIKEYIASKGWSNVHLLENDVIKIDGITYIGATLWTDMNKGDPRARYEDMQSANNYKKIKFKVTRKVTSEVLELTHLKSKRFIEDYCEKYPDETKVLITHQSPLLESWTAAYPDLPVEWGDVSDGAEWVAKLSGVDVICHGHLHKSLSYKLNEKKVFCMPRGYAPNDLNKEFDPQFAFHILVN